MTIYYYLDKIESMTFELLKDVDLDQEKIDHIADRIECTFYDAVASLKVGQCFDNKAGGNNANKIKANEKV